MNREKFVSSLVSAALGQVGKREVGHNGGSAVRAYQSATYLAPGDWPWCAAFVCWCFRAASLSCPVDFKLPVTPRAYGFEAWGRSNWNLIESPSSILRGDLVIYEISHIGIAVRDSVEGRFLTVEGNTNPAGSREGDGVYQRERGLSFVRSIVRMKS